MTSLQDYLLSIADDEDADAPLPTDPYAYIGILYSLPDGSSVTLVSHDYGHTFTRLQYSSSNTRLPSNPSP